MFRGRKTRVHSGGVYDKSHHDVKGLPLEPWSLGQFIGIELRGRVSHEFRFEDVAGKTVGQKATLVDLHFFGGSLEVQRNYEFSQRRETFRFGTTL